MTKHAETIASQCWSFWCPMPRDQVFTERTFDWSPFPKEWRTNVSVLIVTPVKPRNNTRKCSHTNQLNPCHFFCILGRRLSHFDILSMNLWPSQDLCHFVWNIWSQSSLQKLASKELELLSVIAGAERSFFVSAKSWKRTWTHWGSCEPVSTTCRSWSTTARWESCSWTKKLSAPRSTKPPSPSCLKWSCSAKKLSTADAWASRWVSQRVKHHISVDSKSKVQANPKDVGNTRSRRHNWVLWVIVQRRIGSSQGKHCVDWNPVWETSRTVCFARPCHVKACTTQELINKSTLIDTDHWRLNFYLERSACSTRAGR